MSMCLGSNVRLSYMSDPLMSRPATNPNADPLQRAVNNKQNLQQQLQTGDLLKKVQPQSDRSFVVGSRG